MASPDPRLSVKRTKPQLRDSDWAPYRDLVYIKYLVEERELGEVLAELHSRGLDTKCVTVPAFLLWSSRIDANLSATAK